MVADLSCDGSRTRTQSDSLVGAGDVTVITVTGYGPAVVGCFVLGLEPGRRLSEGLLLLLPK
jgi:hypothetical protein